ncbi:MAG: 1,4-alpha-glucan branching protein GlgB [Lachnospiraceae bacterium]|nr:1,4-alpha-glucan branching protein GlgB [Lachnospiraceae bacterium]
MADEKRVFLSSDDAYLFGQGTHYDIYKKLGAHPSVEKNKKGYFFGVWAPNATAVHVTGSFNDWNEESHPLQRMEECGIWTAFYPGIKENELYKFLITTQSGEKIYKADPFANYAELRPGTASKTTDLSGFRWTDKSYYDGLKKKDSNRLPVAIYECHIGSWMKHPDGTEDGFYSYREFADRLVKYLKEMQYTHIELMGIAEHPFDGSWGYQVTGYYAPTSRYGTPKDFMYLVNLMHKHDIGVILDWVPAHFCPDAHGLARFDGNCIFEDPDPRKGEHPDWGTRIFNFEKNEVRNYLIANALYWIKEFHIDGLRVDAVASMLYLDYGKQDGQWVANKYGGKENLDAIAFFRHLNSVVRGTYPNVLMIAEESTAWPGITAPLEKDGLYFTFKWNMGWMHDFCDYMKLDPYFRRGAHNMLTFAMSYNEAENYILPLSHDEVVHLKCSMLEKMPGFRVDKFANLRAGYTFMFGHAGKKLLFMGQEFAQSREWSEKRELDWFLLEDPLHAGMKNYVRDLLKIYRKYPSMYLHDNSWQGFEWINADDGDRSIYSFFRKDGTGKGDLLFVINMTPMQREAFRVGVPREGTYTKLLDSSEEQYGGSAGGGVPSKIKSVPGLCDYRDHSIGFDLPPYAALVFLIPKAPAGPLKKAK